MKLTLENSACNQKVSHFQDQAVKRKDNNSQKHLFQFPVA